MPKNKKTFIRKFTLGSIIKAEGEYNDQKILLCRDLEKTSCG